jgi:hypothetical protein
MSKDLIPNDDDGFAVAENNGGQFIKDAMVKFIDTAFIVDKTEELPDEPLVATGVVTAWVHWGEDNDGNKRPIEHRVTEAGKIHPDRDDLPDQDESQWSPGLDGKPADPWKDTRYLYLINPRSGQSYTFVTDSYGGRRAVGSLKSKILNVRWVYPGAVPLIKCTSAPFKTQYGMKRRPEFKILEWRNRGGGSPIEDPISRPQLEHKLEQMKTTAKQAEFDDNIPF